jgi:hypothetical protein
LKDMNERLQEIGDRIDTSVEELLEFLDSPGGRRLRRIAGTGLILSIPLVMRLPWLRASPIGKLIEITGGAALLVKLAEVIRDWERAQPVPAVIDLPAPPPAPPAA